MTSPELQEAREALRGRGEVTGPVLEELAAVASHLVRFGALPPAMAPYGTWDGEAAQEVLQAWLEGKLLRGDLAALLDRARTPAAFRRMAERSLRHWVLSQRQRSQTQNLYGRLAGLLQQADFEVRQPAAKLQQTYFAPAGQDWEPFTGDDRALLAAAWSVGDLELIRYSGGADKLSPLLSTDDLDRFIRGMFEATRSSLSLAQLTQALALRFALMALPPEEIEAAGDLGVEEAGLVQLELEEVARAVLAELTGRQTEVLLATERGESLEKVASKLGCAISTVHNEQRRIAAVLTRYSTDRQDRDQLLKKLLDLLYGASG